MRSMLGVTTVLLAVPGCYTGKNEVIFVTRTNLALDFDVKPMNTSIGYKRDELVLAPVDSEGNVLPVLTSVGVDAQSFSFGANHSFATGDAALLLSKYVGSDTDINQTDPINENTIRTMSASCNAIRSSGREGYVFTTDTTIGLAMSWDASSTPTALSLGYKRKELALVPVENQHAPMLDEEGRLVPGGDPAKVTLASLLATANAGTRVAAPGESGMVVGQTFATGWAATYLAAHPSIRAAVAPAIVPNYGTAAAEISRLEEKADEENREAFAQLDYADALDTWLSELGRTAADKQALLGDSRAVGLVDAATTETTLGTNLIRTANKGRAHPENGAKFKRLVDDRGIKINK